MATTEHYQFTEADELGLIRETVGEIAADYGDEYWRAVNAHERAATEFWADCADAGLLGVVAPREYGGEGMGYTELATVVEEFAARGCLGVGMLYVVTVVFGTVTLVENGTEDQCAELLPPLVDGDLRFCMALTEPGAGHNAPALETTAERTDGGYRITGSKQWISGVDRADKMLLVARTTPRSAVDRRTEGITLFVLDPDAPGIDRRELDTGIPTPERQFEVTFEDVTVPAAAVVGEVGEGLYHLFDTVNPERLVGAADAVGTGRNALDRAVEYASERAVFDQPIGAHQAIQHPIAEAHSKLEAAGLLTRKAAWQLDRGGDAGGIANMAKLRASEAGHEACDVALQTHGGNGFSREYTVIEMWKASRLGRTAPGSSEMMRNHIAERVLGLPRSY